MHNTEIVGRDEDLQAISSFLEPSSAPDALLIEGDAGIGKTTLWRWAVEHAAERGWQVLTAAPAVAEARLAFAAIGDLLRGVVDAVVPQLPPPQKRALEAALLLEEVRGRPPDELARLPAGNASVGGAHCKGAGRRGSARPPPAPRGRSCGGGRLSEPPSAASPPVVLRAHARAGVRCGARAGTRSGRDRRANGRCDPRRARTQHGRSAERGKRRARAVAPSARSRARRRDR